MKKVAVLVPAICLAALLAGCQSSREPEIKIGLIAELTGQIPAVGASCRNAAEMAVEEINGAGGVAVGGKPYRLKLIVEDSAARPEQAAAAAQKLINQDNVLAVIGPNCSSNALPAAEIAEKSAVLMITPWSTDPKTTLNAQTGGPKKYVMRACFTDIFEGAVLAKFALGTLKVKRAAIFYDIGSDVLKIQAELFRENFERGGGRVTACETYNTGDKDFSAQLTKIKHAGPEIIFLPSYYTDVPLQVQQAHRLGITAPFLGSDAWSTEELIKMCGNECEGFFFCNHYSADTKNLTARAFITAYEAKYGQRPDDIAALTYDSFGLLREALNKTTAADRASIHTAAKNITEYKGVTGEMKFTPGSGDPQKSAVIMQIKGGKFVLYAEIAP